MNIYDAKADSIIVQDGYKKLFNESSTDSGKVGWSSYSQNLRFRRLAEFLMELVKENVLCRNFSVIDLGCGLGALRDFMLVNMGKDDNYLGVDFVEEYINHCNKRSIEFRESFGARNASFETRNVILDETIPYEKYDVVVSIGAFNDKFLYLDNNEVVSKLINKILSQKVKVVSFFLPSFTSANKQSNIFYYNPFRLIEQIKSKEEYYIFIDQGYLLHDFSITLVRKTEEVWGKG